MTTKRTKIFPEEGSEKNKRYSQFPEILLRAFLNILRNRRADEILYRKTIIEKLVTINPSWAHLIFTRKIPLNLVCNNDMLKGISDDMPMATKIAMFKKASIDVSKYRMANVDRITVAKRDLIQRGNAVDSSRNSGYVLFTKKK